MIRSFFQVASTTRGISIRILQWLDEAWTPPEYPPKVQPLWQKKIWLIWQQICLSDWTFNSPENSHTIFSSECTPFTILIVRTYPCSGAMYSNIRLGWKSTVGTNTLAYCTLGLNGDSSEDLYEMSLNVFFLLLSCHLIPGACIVKLFTNVIISVP